jgi:hypothetical protein
MIALETDPCRPYGRDARLQRPVRIGARELDKPPLNSVAFAAALHKDQSADQATIKLQTSNFPNLTSKKYHTHP